MDANEPLLSPCGALWRDHLDPGVEYWVEPDNQPPPTSAIVLQPNNAPQPWVVARHDT